MTIFKHSSPIRSYVLRAGRVTPAQRSAIERLWAQFGIANDVPLDPGAIFGHVDHLTLEIGFGNGDAIAHFALAHPQRQFIGIEVHEPGIGRLLQSIEDNALENLRVLRGDAVEVLTRRVPDATLDEVWVYFPDPWPKKRHHKRRLVSESFAHLLSKKLKPGGIARFATDWTPYAEQMLEVLNQAPQLQNLAENGRYLDRPSERTLTKFELRGRRLGHAVHDLAYARI